VLVLGIILVCLGFYFQTYQVKETIEKQIGEKPNWHASVAIKGKTSD